MNDFDNFFTWATKEHRGAVVLKGDVPGHEFHGNQYSDGGGSGGGGDTSENARGKYSGDDKPDAKRYNTTDELINGLQSGERDAEISADAFNNSVESGVRNMIRSGRVPKSTVTKINKIIKSQGSATDSLSGDMKTQRIERIKRNQQIVDIIKASIKP